MLIEQTCYTIACDDCKAPLDLGDYLPHYPHPGDVHEDARDSHEWWSDDVIDLCETCRYKPHADFVHNPRNMDDGDCDRCGADRAEHVLSSDTSSAVAE